MDKSFHMKLANGKEESFETAEQLHDWWVKNSNSLTIKKELKDLDDMKKEQERLMKIFKEVHKNKPAE